MCAVQTHGRTGGHASDTLLASDCCTQRPKEHLPHFNPLPTGRLEEAWSGQTWEKGVQRELSVLGSLAPNWLGVCSPGIANEGLQLGKRVGQPGNGPVPGMPGSLDGRLEHEQVQLVQA